MSKPIIPFGWLPGHWGLRGQTREFARIDYEYSDDYDRAKHKAQLLYDGDELSKNLLFIDLKYDAIDKLEYERKLIEFISDPVKKAERTLEVLLESGEITQLEYEKEKATNDGLPWFHFDVEYAAGELELTVDWNAAYIEFLRATGYGNSAESAEQVIDEYIRDFGRKLSTDDQDEYQEHLGHSFVKSQQEPDGSISYK